MRTPNTVCSIEECLEPVYQRPNLIEKGNKPYCSREHFALGKTRQTKITIVVCAYCEESFQRRKPSQKFCSHFCSNSARKGIHYDGTAINDREGQRRKSYKLLAERDGEVCSTEGCTVTTSWLGRPLTLHVDHINGIHADNSPENLRFLCPNCHTQTPTYAGRNQKYQKSLTSRDSSDIM